MSVTQSEGGNFLRPSAKANRHLALIDKALVTIDCPMKIAQLDRNASREQFRLWNITPGERVDVGNGQVLDEDQHSTGRFVLAP
jgi:hypothetical protein